MSFVKFYVISLDKKLWIGCGIIDYIVYIVEIKEVVDEFYDIVVWNDLKIEEFVDCEYFKSLYICELGGLRIEFVSVGFGFIIDELFEIMGDNLVLLSFLEEKRIEIEIYFGGDLLWLKI